jgi:hypothetical protein
VYAVAAALKETESSVRICVALIWATLALLRVDEALASDSDDSVPHFAAEKPDHAASSATTESRIASKIATRRSRCSCAVCS